MRNKVLFVIGLTRGGGAEKRAILISKLLKKNFETRVFAFSGDKIDGVDYVFKPTYQEYKRHSIFKRIKALRDYIEQEKPDFVFSFVPHINFFTTRALKCKRFNKIKHVIGMVFYKFSGINSLLLKYSIKHANAVYYQVEEQKLYTPCKCYSFVLPNPIFFSQTSPNHKEKFKFMSVGRLEEQKGFDVLIKAFKTVNENNKDATLDIFGLGSQKNNLIDLIRSLSLDGVVKIHDYTDDIEKEYYSHDVFLFTTKMEGFPNALAEAMAHGLICFTTDFKTGRKELVENGVTGFVCSSRDPNDYSKVITENLNNYDNAQKVALNGYKHIKNMCCTDTFIERCTKVLRDINN